MSEKFVSALLDSALARAAAAGVETFVAIFDFDQFGLAQFDTEILRTILLMLARYYPERLGHLWFVHCGLVFSAFWKIAQVRTCASRVCGRMHIRMTARITICVCVCGRMHIRMTARITICVCVCGNAPNDGSMAVQATGIVDGRTARKITILGSNYKYARACERACAACSAQWGGAAAPSRAVDSRHCGAQGAAAEEFRPRGAARGVWRRARVQVRLPRASVRGRCAGGEGALR